MQTGGAGERPKSNRNLFIGAGVALVALLMAVGAWSLASTPKLGPTPTPTVLALATTTAQASGTSGLDGWVAVDTSRGNPTPVVVAGGNTPTAQTVEQTPVPPTSTADVAQLPAEDTPTLVAGAATFTPQPGDQTALGKPRVLGITAGVGMRIGEVAGQAPLAVSFSEAMDQPSAQSAFMLNPAVVGNFAWSRNTLLFTPNSPLAPSTLYTVTLAASAKSQGGDSVAAPLSASFKTAPPPAILRTLPSMDASEAPTDTIVTLTFNRPMIPLTALQNQPDPAQWVTISPAVKGRWVWLGTSAAGFRAESGFLPSTVYTVEAKAGWPDAAGVATTAGATVRFTTIKPAVLSVEPSNGSSGAPLEAPVIVRFNMPMDHASVEGVATLPFPAAPVWSADSTVVTFTFKSLLDFSHTYDLHIGGKVSPLGGQPVDLVGSAQNNAWSFHTTDPTTVNSHQPDSRDGQVQPADSFGFSFNNPVMLKQDVASLLTIDPKPEGYIGQLTLGETGVYTSGVKLLPDTTYKFALKAGLKDKWGFPVAPASWEVKIGPLPPSISLGGGNFQPIYSEGPSRVRFEGTNLSSSRFHLYALGEGDVRAVLVGNMDRDGSGKIKYPGNLAREWDVALPKGQDNKAAVLYPTIALTDNADRLPPGYYGLRVTASSPYSSEPLEQYSVLIVGRTGVVTKSEGRNLLVWVADLGSGRPVPGYKLRVEQLLQAPTAPLVQHGATGQDGVMRLVLDDIPSEKYVQATAVWSEVGGDALLATTGWTRNLYFGYGGDASNNAERAALYTDRPIYRPAQTVYYRGVVRQDDDARYSLPPAGTEVQLFVSAPGDAHNVIYTGTATLSPLGTLSGQFLLHADAPTGDYTLIMGKIGQGADVYNSALASASFRVEEYRKPDFQVNVTARESAVQGDPITATIASSYYFGGPLPNVTTTVNLRSDPYYFSWSDPDTGEYYTFGNFGGPRPLEEFGIGRPPQKENQPTQSFQTHTDKDGIATVDVSRYVTTTEGSQSLLIEGQVQDLSNQAVANSTSMVVHQGQFYVGLRVSDYVATAKQPLTVTVRTVDSDGKRLQPNASVHLRFVRKEWTAPTDSNGQWQERETPAGEANVTTDKAGRASYLLTPQEGGEYEVYASSRDSRGNSITTSLGFYAASADPGYVPWRYDNEQQVQLVADKKQYKVGDVARILVTSPFTEATGLLTVERGHLKRYHLVTIKGGAPTIEVPLEDGDVPNVYVGLTLLGGEKAPGGAPADWANHVTMRQGYVNVSLDTSGKKLDVSIEPQGKGPFAPGTTASVKVTTRDSNGKPAPGELSLAVVDEAIYALAGDTSTALFDAYWGERGLGVTTGTSFTSNEQTVDQVARMNGAEAMPMSGGAMANDAARKSTASEAGGRGGGEPQAPQKVRSDFRDTAFWQATVSTGADGTALVPVPLPDNLTTWRLTSQGINAGTQAGRASTPLTVTQPLLLRPVQPRFLTTGDNPRPQAIIHNNTGDVLQVEASLVVSGALSLDAQPAAAQQLTLQPGTQSVVTWSGRVGEGDTANLRYWVHTVGNAGEASYREDAVAAHLPVKAFAAPETVATSGEVGGTRQDESIFLPYSVSPLLGEMVVQVSPSLAAAATGSINFVEEYPYESTDGTVSRFLPLVTLEKVYNEQGLKTPYAARIPGILSSSLKRLATLQQPDGGWAWWERGPSEWWQTGYVVQGLIAARDAGYAVPGDMLQRAIERLQNFQKEGGRPGIDETYHLNMRAYSLYVLSQATGANSDLKAEGRDLAGQTPRLSTHARAWLAIALGKLGMQTESKAVLDSLAASARQSSTTAHWEEGTPDYWSMGTDNRATALAIDALVTLQPNDPLVPKAVRWLMTAEKEGHWLSTQETSISLVTLAHYIRASKELTGDYTWQVTAFDKLLGSSVVNSANITNTATLHLPVAGLPQNTLGTLGLARSSDKGKMYYQVSLRYYVPGEGIKSRSEGLAISRSYYKLGGSDPVTEAAPGELLRVRLNIVVPETSYYVQVTDPLPAGLEGVNGSLNTTSFTERPPNPQGVNAADGSKGIGGSDGLDYSPWWRWGPFNNVEMRDDRTVLFAQYMAPGTYVYEYYARATTPGVYMALPAHVELVYYPDVFGHSDGGQFVVK